MADAEAAPSSAVARTLNRIVVGISGASGAIYGVRLLQALQGQPGVEAHAVVSDAGWRTPLQHECGVDGPAALQALAPGHQLHDVRNVGATLASGSFRSHAMVVAPCSMRTLAADCPRAERQPAHPRGGRHAQRAPQAGADGARNPAAPGAPAQHASP